MKYFIFSILLFITFTSSTLAYNCPFGNINDPFPGQCALYTDQNNDNLCDNSQTDEALKINYISSEPKESKTNYYIWQIIITFISFQLIGISLIEYNKLKKIHWRKINNYGLFISFILVFITSLVFLASLAGIAQVNTFKTYSYLHTEFGLIMILFSIEHLLRRWQHFLIKLKK